MPTARPDPAVSIVVATYNRSGVLRYAIESVLAQTRADWEVVVVGDACTDDTAEVVAAFGDPRIRFLNLAENVGEQAGPNNVGVAQARGRYVAYLNHDDLWFPDHLARTLEAIERDEADLVFTRTAALLPGGGARIGGVAPTGRYAFTVYPGASSWLARRELIHELGGWRSAYACRQQPSQDFLVRAHRAGKRLVAVPRLTVLALQSGLRPGAYVDGRLDEHEAAWRRLRQDPGFRAELLEEGVTFYASRVVVPAPLRMFVRSVQHVVYWTLARLGVHPNVAMNVLRRRRKGAFIDDLRVIRGLAPLDPRNALVRTLRLHPEEPTP